MALEGSSQRWNTQRESFNNFLQSLLRGGSNLLNRRHPWENQIDSAIPCSLETRQYEKRSADGRMGFPCFNIYSHKQLRNNMAMGYFTLKRLETKFILSDKQTVPETENCNKGNWEKSYHTILDVRWEYLVVTALQLPNRTFPELDTQTGDS